MCSTPLMTTGTGGDPPAVPALATAPPAIAPTTFEAADTPAVASFAAIAATGATAATVADAAGAIACACAAALAATTNPRVPRFARSAITLDADTARASPLSARWAAAPASSPSRSMKYRFALSPGNIGAASRNVVNDIPALQAGLDGPAGKRAARSPRI